jgi:predicted TIM-barrel fold metal-dependent hydrolase
MRHQFFPDAATELTHPIMEEAAKLKIPIICHSGDFTFAEPSRIEPLIQTFPDVTVVLSHFGSQWVVFDADLYGVLKRNENAYSEIGWGPLHFLRLCVTAGLKDKLVLGTDSPPNDEGMWIRAIEVLGYDPPLGVRLSAEDRENILWKTAARIFKVDI